MRLFLLQFVIFFFLTVNGIAQYTITGSVNSSSLSCATFSGNSVIYVGNGTTSTTLIMNQNLNLYNSCLLGPIQFIIRNNASVDFSSGNDYLVLPLGSSIVIESGGTLIGGSCNASERIYIGNDLVASCNGQANADYSFGQLISNGGYNYVKTTASSVCGSGTATIGVSVFPTPTASTTYNLYTTASGGIPISPSISLASPFSAVLTTPIINSNTTYYVAATTALVTTPRRAVAITVNPIPVIVSTIPSSICGKGMITLGATTSAGTINWYAAATGGTSLGTGTSFTTSSISNTTTYYAAATNLGCTTASRTPVVATVNPVPVITIQPISQLECEGNSVRFKVVALGSGLTYTWQCKRPTDASFSTITDDTNTVDSQTDNIRIGNVGSAQYPNGTQFQVIVSNGTCNVTSSVATLTVNEITNVTVGTNVTQCFGTNYSYTVTTSYPANVVSYQWRKSVTSGVWNAISDGAIYSGTNSPTLNITGGTPAESGEYRVYITFKSSGADCNVTSSSRNRKITFLPKLTIPAATIAQPSCVSILGTITVTVQSPTDVYSFDNGFSYQSSNIKAGLAAGFYNVIIKNTAGCVSPMEIYEIVPVGQPSIWDGLTWLNGNPDINRGITFEGSFNSISDLEGCSCQVINGANVIFNSNHTLKLAHAVAVINGTLTFENNASLVQVDDAAINSGNIIYKRETKPVNRYDYTYWSSAVKGQTLKQLSFYTLFDRYFSYDDQWKVSLNGVAIMEAGHGYIVRAPQTYSISGNPQPFTGIFTGVPNNNITPLALVGNKVYLLGNPYPSALNADLFLDYNSAVLQGTLYFWTHATPPVASGTTVISYKYTASDYASYNRTGGIKAAISGGEIPTGKIAAGQGFFASASATGGNLVFNNNMRLIGGISGINNSQFFKTTNDSKTSQILEEEKNRLWLNLSNKEGAFKQALIGYITGATNNYDNGFDGVTYDSNPFIDFYSINQGVNLAIQGRALPFYNQDSVAIGYKSTIQDEFQISIDQTDGVLKSEDVFLEDKELQVLHDLKKEPYSFKTEKGVFNNRFVLRYLDDKSNKMNIHTEISESLNTEIIISIQEGQIKINSPIELIGKVIVYDVLGREIYQKNKIEVKDFIVPKLGFKHQLLVVSVFLSNNKKVNRKIIY